VSPCHRRARLSGLCVAGIKHILLSVEGERERSLDVIARILFDRVVRRRLLRSTQLLIRANGWTGPGSGRVLDMKLDLKADLKAGAENEGPM
jgi:hypothetical protein